MQETCWLRLNFKNKIADRILSFFEKDGKVQSGSLMVLAWLASLLIPVFFVWNIGLGWVWLLISGMLVGTCYYASEQGSKKDKFYFQLLNVAHEGLALSGCLIFFQIVNLKLFLTGYLLGLFVLFYLILFLEYNLKTLSKDIGFVCMDKLHRMTYLFIWILLLLMFKFSAAIVGIGLVLIYLLCLFTIFQLVYKTNKLLD